MLWAMPAGRERGRERERCAVGSASGKREREVCCGQRQQEERERGVPGNASRKREREREHICKDVAFVQTQWVWLKLHQVTVLQWAEVFRRFRIKPYASF